MEEIKTIGLTKKEVEERVNKGLVNYDTSVRTNTLLEIVLKNIFTPFNFLNLGLASAIVLVGSYKNLLFLGVVFCNTLISTIQEIRSKLAVDKLSLIASTNISVIRDGKNEDIKIDEIVLDDVLNLKIGNQIVTDSEILSGSVEVDESYITGEALPVIKEKGDTILSGSFIVSGSCKAKVIHIGEENYTYKISKGVKKIKKQSSEIMRSLNRIIKFISIIIIPLGILLFINQLGLSDSTFTSSVIGAVAAIIGMIPEGLILLTSTVLAVAVLRISKKNILVQELYSIETLARVDTICLDKTGTLTENVQEVVDVIPLKNGIDEKKILNDACYYLNESSSTLSSICKIYNEKSTLTLDKLIPFSSERKYSGVTFKEGFTYIVGAPDILLKNNSILKKIEKYFDKNRVLLLAKTTDNIEGFMLPNRLEPLLIVLLKDKVRLSAVKTLEYFKKEGVDVKVISGDNIKSVQLIAEGVGIAGKAIDMSTIDDKNLEKIVEDYSIFGRVTPLQKKDIIESLKKNGHTVAFAGDGVNDVLALKEADISIALPSGSDAAKNVSQLVLIDSSFENIPEVVLEGRRTINNIERSATLFLCKTMYSTLLAIIFLFINLNYPFAPIQLTLMSVFTIGIPAFFLALEPNKERVKGTFLINVLSKSFPTSLTIVINIIIISLISTFVGLESEQISTLAVITTGFTAFMLLIRISKPFNIYRGVLLILMIICFSVGVIGLRNLFSLTIITPYMLIIMFIMMIISLVLYNLNTILFKHITKKHSKMFK